MSKLTGGRLRPVLSFVRFEPQGVLYGSKSKRPTIMMFEHQTSTVLQMFGFWTAHLDPFGYTGSIW